MSLFGSTVKNHPGRDGFDLSKKIAFTAKPGELLPIYWKFVLPGDRFRFDVEWFTRTQPVVSSAYTRFREYYDFFFVPLSLLWKSAPQAITQIVDQPTYASQYYNNASINDDELINVTNTDLAAMMYYIDNSSYPDNFFDFRRVDLSHKLLTYLGYGPVFPNDSFASNVDSSYASLFPEGYLSEDWAVNFKLNNVSLSPYATSDDEDDDSDIDTSDNSATDLIASVSSLEMSAFPLMAYHKIYDDFYRFSEWEDASPYLWNADFSYGGNWFTTDLSTSSYQSYQLLTPIDLRYCNWNRDMIFGVMPASQFGDEATVSIASDTTSDDTTTSEISVSVPLSFSVTSSGYATLTPDAVRSVLGDYATLTDAYTAQQTVDLDLTGTFTGDTATNYVQFLSSSGNIGGHAVTTTSATNAGSFIGSASDVSDPDTWSAVDVGNLLVTQTTPSGTVNLSGASLTIPTLEVNSGVATYNYTTNNPGLTVSTTGDVNRTATGTGTIALSTTSVGEFSILALRQAECLQKWREITEIADQNYRSQVQAHFGVTPPAGMSGLCEYIGGFNGNIDISEVLNTNFAGDGTDYTAQIQGKGVGTGRGRRSFTSTQHGIIMCIYHCVPLLDYDKLTMTDPQLLSVSPTTWAIPEFDRIGLQGLPFFVINNSGRIGFSYSEEDEVYTPTTYAGYNPRYYDYKTDVDQVMGAFSTTLEYWVAPITTDFLLDFLSTTTASTQALTYAFFKVNPHIVDSIFGVNADSTWDTDELLINCQIGCRVVRPLSRSSVPY